MLPRKILALFLVLLFFIPMACFTVTGSWPDLSVLFSPAPEEAAAERVEASLTEAFPGRERLSANTAMLQTSLGRNQENGCFYNEEGIIRNLPEADKTVTEANLAALKNYSDDYTVPFYLLLTPTSAAIEQNRIPTLALDSLFNQKIYIQQCYDQLSARFGTIDGYGSLFSHQEEYLFYRTDSRLTALGCYYLYTGAADKLGYNSRTMDYFSVAHITHDYKGELARLLPYAEVKPDMVSVFHYQMNNRTMELVHDPLGRKEKAEMFQYAPSSDPLAVYLGEDTGVTDILVNDTPATGSLLVLSDGTLDPLFPLLALHYQHLRLVDLSAVSSSGLREIDPDQFDQVLCVFSVETFGYETLISDAIS